MSANALLSVSVAPLAAPGGAGSSRATETGDAFAALIDAAAATEPTPDRVPPAKAAVKAQGDDIAIDAATDDGLTDATLQSPPAVQPTALVVVANAAPEPSPTASGTDAPNATAAGADPAKATADAPDVVVAPAKDAGLIALPLVQGRADDTAFVPAAQQEQAVTASDGAQEPVAADRPIEPRTAEATAQKTEPSRDGARSANDRTKDTVAPAAAPTDPKDAARASVVAKPDAPLPTSPAADAAPPPARASESAPASASAVVASLRALDAGATLRASTVAPAPVAAGKGRLAGLIADASLPALPVVETADGSNIDTVTPRAVETSESPREIIAGGATPKAQGDGKTAATPTPDAAPSPKSDAPAKPDAAAPAVAKPPLPGTVAVAASVTATATAEAAEPVLPGAQAAAPTEAPIATPHHTGLSSLARATIETTALLAGQITRRLEARSSRFELALTPEGLGRVDVSMEIDADGQLAARLVFDNPLAATELRGRADELRRQLEDAGFTLARDALDFAERDPSSGGSAFDRRQNRAHAYAHRAAAELETDITPAPRWSPLSQTPQGVDMKV